MTYQRKVAFYYEQTDDIEALWSKISRQKAWYGADADKLARLCDKNISLYADILSTCDRAERKVWSEQIKSIPAQKRLCMLYEKRKDTAAARAVCVRCLKFNEGIADAKKRLAKYDG